MPAETTETPVTTTIPNAAPETTSPAAVFGSDDAPQWVKEAGLEKVHQAGQQPPAKQEGQQPTQQAQLGQQTQQPNQQQQTPQAAVSTQPTVDPTAIATAVTQALAQHQGSQQQAQPARSDADLAKELNVFTATPELYKSILGVDAQPEQVAALNNAFQGVAKQAVTIAQVLMQRELSSIRSELAPYITHTRDAAAKEQVTLFETEFPQLKNHKHVYELVYNQVKASGQKFPDAASARKFVGEQTLAFLAKSNIPLSSSQPSTSPTRTAAQPQSRPMAPTSVGGRSGGSGSASAPPDKHKAIWG